MQECVPPLVPRPGQRGQGRCVDGFSQCDVTIGACYSDGIQGFMDEYEVDFSDPAAGSAGKARERVPTRMRATVIASALGEPAPRYSLGLSAGPYELEREQMEEEAAREDLLKAFV